jgi:competence protein ComEC
VYAAYLPGASSAIASNGVPVKLPKKLRLSWYYPDQKIKAGQQWSFTVKLKRPHGSLNPGGFDYERWLFSEGIGATGYVRPSPAPGLLGNQSVWFSIDVWRQAIADKVSATSLDANSRALIKALTIGDGNSIDQQHWEIFRRTGTTHLMVISGSHIALVAGLVYWLVLRLWARIGVLRWSPQVAAAWSALLAGIVYAGLAGFSVPTQRAVIMLAVGMIAIVLQRNHRPFHTLAVAMFAVLLWDPLAVLSPGFWLSFIAVALIIYVIAGRLGALKPFWSAIKINWATSVGLSPLLLLFFQQVSVISPLANLLAVPLISLVLVPLALVAVVVLMISMALAGPLLLALDYLLRGLMWLLENLAELPNATINHALPSYWALLFAVPGILLLIAPKGIPGRWLGLVMLLPLAFTEPKQREAGAFEMTLLDVGQGLAAVVQTANHQLVFDTGAKFSTESDMGQSVLLPFLRSQGIDSIDTLIVSHGDNDHIGGAASLLLSMPTKQVLTSVPQKLSDFSPTFCSAGHSWLWDEVKFSILSPQREFISENDNSCVLLVTGKYGAVLLTGDIEAAAESWLVDNVGENLQAKVLIAPHHGSKTSSTAPFLQTVKPEFVLIPAGYRNQFGHPHPSVLQRYQQAGISWLSSASSGAIDVKLDKTGSVVTSMRQTNSHYWNAK